MLKSSIGLPQIQVSLRGASAREISRDALLEKVSQEREHRNYARKAVSASIFIQVYFSQCFCVFFSSIKLCCIKISQVFILF